MTSPIRLAVVMAAGSLLMSGSTPSFGASPPPQGSNVKQLPAPMVILGTIAIRTIGKNADGTPLNGATLWSLKIVGGAQYGPFNIPLNTTKTVKVVPGTYTLQGGIGELNNAPCPAKSVTVQAAKTAVTAYMVVRQVPGQATCT